MKTNPRPPNENEFFQAFHELGDGRSYFRKRTGT